MNIKSFREDLKKKTIKVLKDNPPLSPVTRLVQLNNKKVIWKDYSERSWWVKDTWGKLLISHESCMLKYLQGIKGIPKLIKQIDKYGFIAEYLNAESLDKFNRSMLTKDVFDNLKKAVSKMHKRGVVHLDLGQRRNIMLDKDHTPYFLDFANAFRFRQDAFGFKQFFKLLCTIDYNALLKFKHRFFPESLSDKEKKELKRFFFIRRFWIFKLKHHRVKDLVR